MAKDRSTRLLYPSSRFFLQYWQNIVLCLHSSARGSASRGARTNRPPPQTTTKLERGRTFFIQWDTAAILSRLHRTRLRTTRTPHRILCEHGTITAAFMDGAPALPPATRLLSPAVAAHPLPFSGRVTLDDIEYNSASRHHARKNAPGAAPTHLFPYSFLPCTLTGCSFGATLPFTAITLPRPLSRWACLHFSTAPFTGGPVCGALQLRLAAVPDSVLPLPRGTPLRGCTTPAPHAHFLHLTAYRLPPRLSSVASPHVQLLFRAVHWRGGRARRHLAPW